MAIVFGISVIVVGWDTVVKSNRLLLAENQRWILVFIAMACFFNLGPVFITFLKLICSSAKVRRMYSTEKEWHKDKQAIEVALSSTKTKEALCENLPMLIIVCFKMALSSQVSLLEVISSASSACLLSKVILTYLTERMKSPLGWVSKIIGSFVSGAYIYFTLVLITTFAIESERDGILVSADPKQGVEESSGKSK